MTKKIIIGIVIAALILGVVLYFAYRPKPQQTEGKKTVTDAKIKIFTPAILEGEKGQAKDILGGNVSPINSQTVKGGAI